MTLGLVGRKVGMTRVFTDDGDSLPVTVLDVSDNRVTQIKSAATDGYNAVQVTFGKRRATRVNKAAAGHLAKASTEAGHLLREFRVAESELGNFKLGGKVGVDSGPIAVIRKRVEKRLPSSSVMVQLRLSSSWTAAVTRLRNWMSRRRSNLSAT